MTHIRVAGLLPNTFSLEVRVTNLEDNDGNSSISELETRVEILEGTVSDHQNDIVGMMFLFLVIRRVA